MDSSIKELTDYRISKGRITDWLAKHDLEWLKKEKERIEKESGETCTIYFTQYESTLKKYALFYDNGYFKLDHNKGVNKFIRYQTI